MQGFEFALVHAHRTSRVYIRSLFHLILQLIHKYLSAASTENESCYTCILLQQGVFYEARKDNAESLRQTCRRARQVTYSSGTHSRDGGKTFQLTL